MQKVGGPHGPEKLSVWKNPNKDLKPYFELPVAEEGYLFEDGRMFGGELFIDGAGNFLKLKDALIRQFGNPDFANESIRLFKWKWQKPEVEIQIFFNDKFRRATVHIERSGVPPRLDNSKSSPLKPLNIPDTSLSTNKSLGGRWQYVRTCNVSVEGELHFNSVAEGQFTGDFVSFTVGNAKGQIIDGQIQDHRVTFTLRYNGLLTLEEKYTGNLIAEPNRPLRMEGSYLGPRSTPCKFTAERK